jgi:hypothetical protein
LHSPQLIPAGIAICSRVVVMSAWTDPLWLAEAHGWIEERVAQLGSRVGGAIDQLHVYPWSTVMRVPTSSGDVYFKANGFPRRQVFVRDGRYLLLDWGDACVSHPFFTLAVTLEGVLAWGLDDIQGSVDVEPFRDAYLVPFERIAVEGVDLHAAAETAMRLGWVCRAVNAGVSGSAAETPVRLRMFLDGRP